MRATREAIDRHLRLRREGNLDGDLAENYAEDVVLLSYEGVHHGHDGVRKLASILGSFVEATDYKYDEVVVEGDYALLRWQADGSDVRVHDGVDSFVVRAGHIVLQTIHYSTAPRRSGAHGARASGEATTDADVGATHDRGSADDGHATRTPDRAVSVDS